MTPVYFRVDGSFEIGLGHLVRCMAIAKMLRNDFSIMFLCKEAPQSFVEEVLASGFLFTRINSDESLFSQLTGKGIVVLDNYFFTTDYQKKISDLGHKLVCVDDLHDKEFYADLVINQIPGTRAEDYNAQCYTQFALGPEYALLRTPFLEKAKLDRRIEKIETVFICFGGADHQNLTTRSLQVILREQRFKKIIVVTGSAYGFHDQLMQVVDSDDRIQHHHNVDEVWMSELMMESDLAVVPASGILLEVLAVGCRVISGMYVDNQRLVFESYKKAGFFESAEDFSVQHLQQAMENVFAFPRAGKKIIDGLSDQRILKCFRQLALEDKVSVRPASESDLNKTFEWASNPEIRKFSFSQNEIVFEEHRNWFLKKVNTPSCYYFLAEIKGEAVGSIRFDIFEGEAIISYLVDTGFQKRGLGIILLKKGLSHLRSMKIEGISKVVGYVMPDNIPSLKAFEKLGYLRQVEGKKIKFFKNLN